MQHPVSPEMQSCIDACLNCYETCLSMASQHCLPMGGKHVEPEHFRLMMACAEICRTSAHFMLIGLPEHKITCRACAEICEACAASCLAVGEMETCVDACRRCAATCYKMAA
ncbi:four-helix bundle copper-binding protein [Muricoccus radiodurans]|uniref:four-helix bundle copper-binding protein n=1 Tax=Muricoccus radiodurans TaxID=2231721 RepID=UPI003CE7DB44